MVKDFEKYAYVKDKSIVFNLSNDYELTVIEYNAIHMFYLTHTLIQNESRVGYLYTTYGWQSNSIKQNGLKQMIENCFNVWDKGICLAASETKPISDCFKALKLSDGCQDFSFERVVLGALKGSNNFEKFLKLIRDCLAHGSYALKLYENEKMLVIENHDNRGNNVTGRAVLKLSTLLSIVSAVDIKHILRMS